MSYLLKHVISSATRYGFIKKQDRRLLQEFSEKYRPFNPPPILNSALFYPSAGTDFITPIILGLPFCREFYFYDHEPLGPSNRTKQNTNDYEERINKKLEKITDALKKINGFDMHMVDWIINADEALINFNYDGTERTIHWVHKDNKDFLNEDVNLTFYFHRGDSCGEGGSDQLWDSGLLPILMKKIPSDTQCFFVTDGKPGGLLELVKENSHVFKADEGVEGNYYFGILPNSL